MGKKEKTLLVIMTLALILIVGTLTYAFFSAGVNNDNNQEASITTGDMKLTFADGNNGFASELSIGQSATKTFTIENTGSLDTGANLYWLDFTNNYTLGSLTYTLEYSDSENGEYTILKENENVPQSATSSKILIQDKIVVPVDTKYYYKLTITLNNLEDVDQNADLTAVMNTKFTLEGTYIPESHMTLATLGLTANAGTPNFDTIETTEKVIYEAEDDYGTSYYFRGAVNNNKVHFAGKMWKIIRINGNGTLRIMLDESEENLEKFMWGDEARYKNSETKLYLENWYDEQLLTYDSYISDTIFCDDSQYIAFECEGCSDDERWSNYSGINGLMVRIYNDEEPTLKCQRQNDRMTVLDTVLGNGLNNRPIGLITADEVVFAGGTFDIPNDQYYLYTGYDYWTMTFMGATDVGQITGVHSNGEINNIRGDGGKAYLLPVINLTAEYTQTLTWNDSIGAYIGADTE